MKIPAERPAIQQVIERLVDILDPGSLPRTGEPPPGADGVVSIGRYSFLIHWKTSGDAGAVATAASLLAAAKPASRGAIPLLAVPYMGEAGRARCADAGIAWLDLSGNARIHAPGLIVLVEGKPNLYKRPGRPSAVFAPMGSRIARCLLVHPERPLTQRELARTVGIDEGYVSRIVGRLERDGLITRERNGAVRPGSPDLLLDAWREVHDFTKHRLILGHIPARSGDELLRQLAASLEKADVAHAVTGLAAAWLLDRFAGFRTVTCYLEEEPSDGLLADLSFREDERGANVWLAVPNDPGVFYGAAPVEGIRCVHPVQVYLDLSAQHERAVEAAARLRSGHLNWSSSA